MLYYYNKAKEKMTKIRKPRSKAQTGISRDVGRLRIRRKNRSVIDRVLRLLCILFVIIMIICVVFIIKANQPATADYPATSESETGEKTRNIEDLRYSDVQGDTTDEIFANFRNVTAGNIKDGMLYRSASPSDNSHKRAAVVDKLMSTAGVKYIVNLSDNEDELTQHIKKSDFDSPYALSLYKNGKVLLLDMDAQFKEPKFKKKLVKGLTAMADNTGPYLIHCIEGKDRTGYVMMVIEALLGASYDEIVSDYMLTYDNYYGITSENDPESYAVIKYKNIDHMLRYTIGDEDKKQNLSEIADLDTRVKKYLLSIGMSEKSIDRLIQKLS